MRIGEEKEVERGIEEIREMGEGFGVDFYGMRYEICGGEIIYRLGG